MKHTLQEMKRQAIDEEKIFARHMLDKGLAFKIYKEFLKFNDMETDIQLTQAKICTDITEGKWMVNKCIKRFSTSFAIRKIQIKVWYSRKQRFEEQPKS